MAETNYTKSKLSDSEYRDSMDGPMEDLAVSMWGVGDSGPPGLSDAEIVMWASRKITMFRQMLKATGMSDALIQSTLDN